MVVICTKMLKIGGAVAEKDQFEVQSWQPTSEKVSKFSALDLFVQFLEGSVSFPQLLQFLMDII